jgi:hypothetical protein
MLLDAGSLVREEAQRVTTDAVLTVDAGVNGTVEVDLEGGSGTGEGVPRGSETWATVVPQGAGQDALPTVQQVDTTRSTARVFMLRETTLDEVYASSGVDLVADPAAAQVILRFLDARGDDPLQNIQAYTQCEAIVYDLGTGFSRDAEGTGSAGLVLLVNVPASTMTVTQLALSYEGAFEGDLDIQVRGGAATLLEVGVD